MANPIGPHKALIEASCGTGTGGLNIGPARIGTQVRERDVLLSQILARAPWTWDIDWSVRAKQDLALAR
ncbi:hypothetical protein VTN77DRAFT_889 [Rasamsonia byssochlamydoides]|uniref:uncharacterized protein n=1 Tax=Rasamsonia byssochlamydoides TaxID=89139 RepID=UPI0037421A6C